MSEYYGLSEERVARFVEEWKHTTIPLSETFRSAAREATEALRKERDDWKKQARFEAINSAYWRQRAEQAERGWADAIGAPCGCLYCDWRGSTGVAVAVRLAELRAHVTLCPNHPLRGTERDRDDWKARAEKAEAAVRAADTLFDELENLISVSSGAAGFHMDGDVALWEEILDGGKLEMLRLEPYRAAREKEKP